MISDYLSRRERLEAMKAGAISYASALDVKIAEEKRAAGRGTGSGGGVGAAASKFMSGLAGHFGGFAHGAANTFDKTVLFTSLLLGIPVGLAAHALGRSAAGKNFEEEMIKSKINLYNDATEDLKRGID